MPANPPQLGWLKLSTHQLPGGARPVCAAFLDKLIIELWVFSFCSGTVRAYSLLPEEENMK